MEKSPPWPNTRVAVELISGASYSSTRLLPLSATKRITFLIHHEAHRGTKPIRSGAADRRRETAILTVNARGPGTGCQRMVVLQDPVAAEVSHVQVGRWVQSHRMRTAQARDLRGKAADSAGSRARCHTSADRTLEFQDAVVAHIRNEQVARWVRGQTRRSAQVFRGEIARQAPPPRMMSGMTSVVNGLLYPRTRLLVGVQQRRECPSGGPLHRSECKGSFHSRRSPKKRRIAPITRSAGR